MNSTRIWMKLMGFHNFYTGKYSNYSLIGKDNRERFADKRTHQHSTDIACQCKLFRSDTERPHHCSSNSKILPFLFSK